MIGKAINKVKDNMASTLLALVNNTTSATLYEKVTAIYIPMAVGIIISMISAMIK
jgi:hypothetical protein